MEKIKIFKRTIGVILLSQILPVALGLMHDDKYNFWDGYLFGIYAILALCAIFGFCVLIKWLFD